MEINFRTHQIYLPYDEKQIWPTKIRKKELD